MSVHFDQDELKPYMSFEKFNQTYDDGTKSPTKIYFGSTSLERETRRFYGIVDLGPKIFHNLS